jgi:hypothetical protein
MDRSLEEEENGVHEIRVRVWGFEEKVTSMEFEREREREREREVRIEVEEDRREWLWSE